MGMEFKIERAKQLKEKPVETKLGFGRHFSDHMLVIDYTEGIGWHDGRIIPYGPIEMDPACMVLHYAQETFEGLKAYRHTDGSIALFRPEINAQRLIKSNERLCMPTVPVDLFLKGIEELVEVYYNSARFKKCIDYAVKLAKTPFDFYEEFSKAIPELKDIYYGDAAKFTSAVTQTINQIIKSANLIPENEYYRIDIIGWKYQNNDAKPEAKSAELNWHQWDLEIAVEHENNPVDWTDELTKLIHIRCTLKVIIGYNYWDCREELEQKKLAYAAKWMQHSLFSYFSKPIIMPPFSA